MHKGRAEDCGGDAGEEGDRPGVSGTFRCAGEDLEGGEHKDAASTEGYPGLEVDPIGRDRPGVGDLGGDPWEKDPGDNASPEGRAKNRRIEISLMKTD